MTQWMYIAAAKSLKKYAEGRDTCCMVDNVKISSPIGYRLMNIRHTVVLQCQLTFRILDPSAPGGSYHSPHLPSSDVSGGQSAVVH